MFRYVLLVSALSAEAADVRVIAGLEQSGSSGAASAQRLFFEFLREWPVSERCAWWGDIRVTSLPRQVNEPLIRIAPAIARQVSQTRVNEIAQAAEFLTGLRFPLERPGRATVVSALAALGASGVMNPEASIPVLELPAGLPERDRFEQRYGRIPSGKTAVLFTPLDRDRYYRQAYVGLRGAARSGATVDLLAGWNEAVTRRGGVVRVEAFYPLSVRGAGRIYFFAKVEIAGSKPREHDRLVLAPADGMPATSPQVWQIPGTPAARDQYRIGIGISLSRLTSGN